VKALAILALTFVLVAATAQVTLAHVDSLGQPDPSWQQIPAASAASGAEAPLDGTALIEDPFSSYGLSLLFLALGVALALDVATAPAGASAKRADQRASDAPATAPEEGPNAMTDAEAIRTVERLPPSASGETRHVLRVAAAIVFGVLFASVLHAGFRSTDSGRGPAADDQVVATLARP